MAKDNKEIHFGDGVRDEALRAINDRLADSSKIIIEDFFDYLDEKAKDLPSYIKDYASQLFKGYIRSCLKNKTCTNA